MDQITPDCVEASKSVTFAEALDSMEAEIKADVRRSVALLMEIAGPAECGDFLSRLQRALPSDVHPFLAAIADPSALLARQRGEEQPKEATG